jgi:hypothetical protein
VLSSLIDALINYLKDGVNISIIAIYKELKINNITNSNTDPIEIIEKHKNHLIEEYKIKEANDIIELRKMLNDAEVERRIKAWADVTMLSIELKLAMMRKRYPELNEDELRELMRKELSIVKDSYK